MLRFEDGAVINQRSGWQASDMYDSISELLDDYRSIEITSAWGLAAILALMDVWTRQSRATPA